MLARSLENPRLIALISALLLVAGLSALSALPTSEDPHVLNRVATVLTPFPGATPERVEALVSEPLEDALRAIPEVSIISSASQAGISVIRVELKDSVTETAPLWSEARDKISDVQPDLPPGALPSRLDDTRGYAFTRVLALQWQGAGDSNLSVLGRYAEELAKRLRVVPGTDLVAEFGSPEEEVLVVVDPVDAARAGLSVTEIARAIESRDAKVSAGQLRGADREWLVEVSGELESLSILADTVIRQSPDGRAMRLRDIATIQRHQRQPPQELAFKDTSEPVVVVGVRMLKDERIGDWSARVQAVTAGFEQQLPANIAVSTLFDQQNYTDERLGGLTLNILAGFVVILSVLFMTLGWRAALIVALALPLTVAFTLACMRIWGLPIHQMSVTGLVVALGIMVDNAIVMTDTVQRLRREGLGRFEAVTRALEHLWLPLAGSTLTTILAFMPIAIMPGAAGEFVSGIALSVIFSLLGSYLISHTLVAGLAGRFLRAGDTHTGLKFPRLSAVFQHLLRLSLNHPWASIALAMVLPVCGYFAATQMTEQFFPPSDRDMFTIEVHLDSAAGISATLAVMDQIAPLVTEKQGVESLHWFVGGSALSFYYNMMERYDQVPGFAQAMVTTTDFDAANRLIPLLQKQLDESVGNAQVLVRKLEQGPPFNAPVEVRVYGPQLDTLANLGDQLRTIALMTDDITHARATLSKGRPKARLVVDENEVRGAGLAPVELAAQLQAVLDGVQGGSILEATEELPIRLRLGEEQRANPADLYRLHLAAPGQPVNLSLLGQLEFEPSAGVIARRQGERVNTVEMYIRAGVLPADVQGRLLQRIEQSGLELPPGYRLELGGETAERDSAVSQLMASVGLILVLLITTVVLSFNSFRLSSIVFAVAALAPGLGLLCVWLFGYPFGFVVIVGLMGLIGLAINAAIVIIAELRSNANAVDGALEPMVDSVMKCTRHIGSTTVTTLGGFMPLILDGGGFWPPFAIAIAGGTLLASVLSFCLVPAVFRLYALRRPFAKASDAGLAVKPRLVAGHQA